MFTQCPKCHSVATVPLVYGKPGHDMMEAAKYGLIELGGCVVDHHDRTCKACGCQWRSGAANPWYVDHTPDVERFLKDLETSIHGVHQALERQFMDHGRHGREALADQQIFAILAEYHEAWDLFADRLQSLGDTICMGDEKGGIRASYATRDARIYIIKHLPWVYSNLHALAHSCHQLGRVSGKGSVDDLKKATMAVAQAREEIQRLWQQMHNAALRGY